MANRNSARRGTFAQAMKNAAQYRMYAEECRRLAHKRPEERAILLEIAEAWTALAERADADQRGGPKPD